LSYGIYFLSTYLKVSGEVLKYAIHTLLIIGFGAFVYLIERPKKVVI